MERPGHRARRAPGARLGPRTGARRPRHAHPARCARDRRAASDHRPGAGAGRRAGLRLPRRGRVHGGETPPGRARGDPGCRPRMQRRPAGPVQPAGARLPGSARSPVRTPASASRVICSPVRPASASTSRVCRPASGAGRRTEAGVAEKRAGGGITLYHPASGCSSSGSASMSSSSPGAAAAGIPASAQHVRHTAGSLDDVIERGRVRLRAVRREPVCLAVDPR